MGGRNGSGGRRLVEPSILFNTLIKPPTKGRKTTVTSIYSQTRTGSMLFLGFLLLGFFEKKLICPIFSKLSFFFFD